MEIGQKIDFTKKLTHFGYRIDVASESGGTLGVSYSERCNPSNRIKLKRMGECRYPEKQNAIKFDKDLVKDLINRFKYDVSFDRLAYMELIFCISYVNITLKNSSIKAVKYFMRALKNDPGHELMCKWHLEDGFCLIILRKDIMDIPFMDSYPIRSHNFSYKNNIK